ncbi:class I SAM-dependent DNA methyltransferase [Clostridium lundense]|uniref:class I SAM-dependent DNA methyltransferase n=1 Tax=Clostridium lundense TaxID=319475 RepID=UPI0004813433|nr:class I SAM-dependent methyltransferase [Clostridium lundense]
MECYKDFAHIYDELIKGDIDYAKWASTMLELCDKYNVKRRDYLDLACGTGNITEQVGKSFLNTWAVDLSYDMLTEAEEKLRAKSIKGKFVCQDISNLNLNKEFDLITCCLDSTNYIIEKEKLETYFKGVYHHLKNSGIFIFDINSYYKLTEILGNNIYNYDSEDVYYIWENNFQEDIVDMYLTFFIKEGEVYKRFDEFHRERAYTNEEIEEVITKCGFEILDKLDNYEDTFLKEDTERIAYVLKK